jgi:hypothetical protein
MSVVTPITAFVTDRARAPANRHLWQLRMAGNEAVSAVADAPIPRRLVYAAVLGFSLLAWFGLIEVAVRLTGL